MVEYKNRNPQLRKHDFSTLLASLEFFFPEAKGKLAMSHACLRGWEISYSTKHTTPMGRAIGTLFASHMSSRGNPRLGVAMYFQVRKGLRPGELFDIRRSDVILPSDAGTPESLDVIVVGLGVRTNTKAKRPQAVTILKSEHPQLTILLERICSVTSHNCKLFPFTIDQYRREIQDIEKRLGLSFGFSAHSPRAGFASEGKARGISFTELREEGRWLADASLRTYIDLVSAAHISVTLRSRGLVPALEFAAQHILEYFPASSLATAFDPKFARRR